MNIKNQFRILAAIIAAMIVVFTCVILFTDDATTRKQKNESLFAPTTVINCQVGCSQCDPCLDKKKPELKIVSLAKHHGKPLVRPQPGPKAKQQSKSVGVLKPGPSDYKYHNDYTNTSVLTGGNNTSWAFDRPEFYQGGGSRSGSSSYYGGHGFYGGHTNTSVLTGGHVTVSISSGGHGWSSSGSSSNGPRVEVPEPHNTLLLMIGGLGLLLVRRIAKNKSAE